VPTSTDKPYRVYRQRRRIRGDGSIPWETGQPGDGKPPRKRRDRLRWRLFRYVRRILYVALAVCTVIALIAYMSFRSAVKERNEKVPASVERQLSPTDGPALTSARNILILGSDTRGGTDRGRADSMIVMRMDVKSRRYAMLSIPRDLEVTIPGLGDEKINSAYANGGPALTIKTVKRLIGEDIHHFVQVDFNGFKELVDALGGVCVNNPKRIRSNSFDGYVWNFKKGNICLNGRRALAYSRVRKNQLDPAESDITRGQRQQAVMDAISAKLVSSESFLHPRKVPRAAVQPLITDITANEMIAFAIGKMWAKDDAILRCRLGGDIGTSFSGQSVITPGEENRPTVSAWKGDIPPRRPQVSTNQFDAGCLKPGQKPV
jgi:polyisoprenyl-teichoic acid--peptidoglycan teichoic acid transferase